MTLQKKNTVIVFAISALMMAMPFAVGVANAESMDASLNADCGFTTTNANTVNFGAFSQDDDEDAVGEVDISFPKVAGSTASARMSISVEDWKTVGTRASGSITLASVAAADTVTIAAVDYDAVNGATSGTDWDMRGNDIQDAEQLAKAIRDNAGSLYKTSNGGTNIVTIQTVARGTAANGVVLIEDTTGSTIITKDSAGVTTEGDMDGAVSTPLTIMNGDTTKFTMDITGAQTTTYGAKTGIITVGTAQEVLGGTDPNESVYMALMIDPTTATFTTATLPYDGPITQAITFTVDTACDGT